MSIETNDVVLRANKHLYPILTFKEAKWLPETSSSDGVFISAEDNETVLAKRIEATLAKDEDNPCSYMSEELAYAIDFILTEQYMPHLYVDNVEVSYGYLDWKISRPAHAVVLSKPISSDNVKISFVKYVGHILEESSLLSDGSVQMDTGYWPSFALDVATKEYSDTFLDRAVRSDITISKSVISATQSIGTKAIYWNDKKTYDVLYCDAPNQEPIHVTISKFVDSHESYEASTLELYMNGSLLMSSSTEEDKLVFNLDSSEDPYASFPVGFGFFLAKSYSCDIPLSKIVYNESDPFIRLQFKLKNSQTGTIEESPIYEFGLVENYVTDYTYDSFCSSSFEADTTNLQKAVDATVSTVKVISSQKTVDLGISTNGSIWKSFYPIGTAFEVSCVETAKQQAYSFADLDEKLSFTFSKQDTMSIDLSLLKDALANQITLIATYYNLNGDIVHSDELDITSYIDFKSDESNRVTTPSGETLFPDTDYGEPFSSKETLGYWDMQLVDGVYKSLNDDAFSSNALCLVLDDNESYSHVRIKFDTSLPSAYVTSKCSVQVKSDGNTGWLSADNGYDGVSKVSDDGDAAAVISKCLYNDRFVTFGRKAYKSKVFVRFIGFKDLSNIEVTKAN